MRKDHGIPKVYAHSHGAVKGAPVQRLLPDHVLGEVARLIPRRRAVRSVAADAAARFSGAAEHALDRRSQDQLLQRFVRQRPRLEEGRPFLDPVRDVCEDTCQRMALFQERRAAALRPGERIIPRDLCKHRKSHGFGEGLHLRILAVHVAAVEEDAGDTPPLPVVIADPPQNVIGRIDGHEFPGGHQEDRICIFPADGHRETAAHHVSQNIVEHIVVLLLQMELLKKLEGRDDAAAGAPDAGLGPAGFDAADAVVSLEKNVLQLIIQRSRLPDVIQDRADPAAPQKQTGRVMLGVAANL